MDGGRRSSPARRRSAARGRGDRVYAAVDLGTNNCRLLVAEPTPAGFKVLDGFSSMVRLGEGLARAGALSEPAMGRTLAALEVVAGKMRAWGVTAADCVATQACRAASNGRDFLERIRVRHGLDFRLIDAEEEARLAVLGCASLIDAPRDVALVVDIGGGSTELSWVDARRLAEGPFALSLMRSVSLPYGVVTLSERVGSAPAGEWFPEIVAEIAAAIGREPEAQRWRAAFAGGEGLLIGASGTLTSMAGVHLRLPRYIRSKVDGLWMTQAEIEAACGLVRSLDHAARAAHPCIGEERADLVIPGAAILQAVLQSAPTPRVRVADRGLREGLLLTLMREEAG